MKLTSFKRTAVAGVAALTLVGASIGAVAAQQAPTSPNPPTAPAGPRQGPPGQQQADHQQREQAFIDAVAAKLGISSDQLRQAMDQARADVGMPQRGPGGPQGGPQGGPGRGEGRMGGGLDAAAQALGVSADQLRQELAGGQTLTQVAQAHNVDPSTVANALKQAANAHIDQEAAAGRIPADQVDTAKQRAAERIDQMMSQTSPQRGPAGQSAQERGPRGPR